MFDVCVRERFASQPRKLVIVSFKLPQLIL